MVWACLLKHRFTPGNLVTHPGWMCCKSQPNGQLRIRSGAFNLPCEHLFVNRLLLILAAALWSRLSKKSGDWCEVSEPACRGDLSLWLFFGKGEDSNKCVPGFCFWRSGKCYFKKKKTSQLYCMKIWKISLHLPALSPSKGTLDEATRSGFLFLPNWSHLESRLGVRVRFAEASD